MFWMLKNKVEALRVGKEYPRMRAQAEEHR